MEDTDGTSSKNPEDDDADDENEDEDEKLRDANLRGASFEAIAKFTDYRTLSNLLTKGCTYSPLA